MKHIGAALAAATLLASSPLLADAPEGREQVSVNVSTQGLDLTRSEDVSRLQSRLNKAIAVACNPGDRVGADLSPDYKCRREMAADVQPTMLQIASRAAKTRLSVN